MAKTIHVELTEESINNAIKEVRKYRAWVLKKETELVKNLAKIGQTVAQIRFDAAVYDGVNDVKVLIKNNGRTATIYTQGKAVAFIEFGTGDKYGHGHPQNDEFGVGPGTWSDNPDLGGKGHWKNEDGWYYAHGKKSHGNKPAMAMWTTATTLGEMVADIAWEVFHT